MKGLQIGLFHSVSGKGTNAFVIIPMCPTHHLHLILLNLIILAISNNEYKLQSSSTYFQQSPITAVLHPQIILSIKFLNALNRCPPLRFRYQIPYPNKTTGFQYSKLICNIYFSLNSPHIDHVQALNLQCTYLNLFTVFTCFPQQIITPCINTQQHMKILPYMIPSSQHLSLF
jgi:hypothetical protein